MELVSGFGAGFVRIGDRCVLKGVRREREAGQAEMRNLRQVVFGVGRRHRVTGRGHGGR